MIGGSFLELKVVNNYYENLFKAYKQGVENEIKDKYDAKRIEAERDNRFSLCYIIILPIIWFVLAVFLYLISDNQEWRDFLSFITIGLVILFAIIFVIIYFYNGSYIKKLDVSLKCELEKLQRNEFDSFCKPYELYCIYSKISDVNKLHFRAIIGNNVILYSNKTDEFKIPLSVVSFTTSKDVKCSCITLDNESVSIILKES